MAKRQCSRCKRFLKKYTRGSLCQRCKSGHKSRPKRRKRKRLSDQAVVNMTYCHDYLRKHPCVDCGETDIVVLQFDHVRGRKRGNVTSLARKGVDLDIVIKEIKKCEARCANCHVRKTAKEQGWYKAK